MTAAATGVHPLIGALELQRQLQGEWPPRVIDVRFDLARPGAGREAFRQGHLPGSVYRHLEHDLSAHGADALCGGRHPLPRPEMLARRLAAWGLAPNQPVVVLDAQGGMFAARLWWMLRWMGHADVQVLDGGWPAWVAAGGAIETGDGLEAEPLPSYPLPAQPGLELIDVTTLQARLGAVRLIDARAPERYRGEVEPLDPVAGHIPGALNHPFARNLGADGRFRPAGELAAAFDALLGAATPVPALPVVHQCGSGVTACHNLLAMALAGRPVGALYAGSWSEWCSDPARPVAAG